MSAYDVLIVGAGHAGAQTAVALRQLDFTGSIGVIGDEPYYPYERPSLSKEFLAGEKTFERLLLRPADFWAHRDVRFCLGQRVVAVDARSHCVTLEDGTSRTYGSLVWATGGEPRRLSCPGSDLAGVHVLRRRVDAESLMESLPMVNSVVVIGGGYIGLEAAAVLVKRGKRVTVLEALDRVLARVAGEPLSRFYEAEHRAHGVDVRLSARVERIEGFDGRAIGVCLAEGGVVPADLIVVGVGIVPVVGPLLAAGAVGGDGVAVDALCKTSLPDVFAIGDCARHANPFADGAHIRLESVQNANDMASTVAKAIVGDLSPYHSVPWFWSSQYDLKLQTIGLSMGHDEAVIRGNPATRAFSVIYLRRGRVVALDCVNAVKDYVQGKKLVSSAAAPNRQQLQDPSHPLKDIVL